MRIAIWKATTLLTLAAGLTSVGIAQTAATAPVPADLTAKSEQPSNPVAAATTASDTNASAGSTTAAKPAIQPTVEQKMDLLENRIEQLENEVREAKAAALATTRQP